MNKILMFLFAMATIAFAETQWQHVGISIAAPEGLEQDETLTFPVRDAQSVADVWKSMGNIPQNRVFVLTPRSASELRTQLDQVASAIRSAKNSGKGFLHLYYSGHGSGKAFHIGGEALNFEEVKSLLGADEFRSRMYVLDVCYGASFFNAKGFKKSDPVQMDLEFSSNVQGEVIISSSARDEQSFESAELGGSVFTTNWLMGLRGAADRNSNGSVSLFEAWTYAYDRTVVFTSSALKNPQHPGFQMDLEGDEDIMLTRPADYETGIVFKNALPGAYQVVRHPGAVLLGELQLDKPGDYSLALENGSYQIVYKPLKGPVKQAEIMVLGQISEIPRDKFIHEQVEVVSSSKGSGSLQVIDSIKRSDSLKLAQKPSMNSSKRLRSGLITLFDFLWLGVGVGVTYSQEDQLQTMLEKQIPWSDYFNANPRFTESHSLDQSFGLQGGFYIGDHFSLGLRSHWLIRIQKYEGSGTEPLLSEPEEEFGVHFRGNTEQWIRSNGLSLGWEKSPQSHTLLLGLEGGFSETGVTFKQKIEQEIFDETQDFEDTWVFKGYYGRGVVGYRWVLSNAFWIKTTLEQSYHWSESDADDLSMELYETAFQVIIGFGNREN